MSFWYQDDILYSYDNNILQSNSTAQYVPNFIQKVSNIILYAFKI